MKTYAVAHEEGVSLGIYPPFVEKGVGYSVFKYTLSDKVYHVVRGDETAEAFRHVSELNHRSHGVISVQKTSSTVAARD